MTIKKLSEANLEFFHKWLHDVTQDGTPTDEDALKIGTYLLGFYEGVISVLENPALAVTKKEH